MAKTPKRPISTLDDDTLKREGVLRQKESYWDKLKSGRVFKREQVDSDSDEDDRGGTGREGDSGRGRRRPRRESYLGDDTPEREDARRKIEIAGLIAETGLASEARRDRDAPRKESSLDEGLESSPTHPLLGDKQQYDGLEPDVNPLPDLTTPEGQEEYQLEQQLKLQKRNELQDRLTNDPSMKPSGPS
ncbi:MAG: hypothetical protein K0U37_01425 [Gammaproteobacteria bacterium]|nr:hypothetical protein [Gammaproteobacteria bacterium]